MSGARDQTDPDPIVDTLVVIDTQDDALHGRRCPLGSSPAVTTVGRDAESTIVLRDDAVSRRHARFERRADGWWVIDSGSTDGIWVDEEPVQDSRLQAGDAIRIGGTIFKAIDSRVVQPSFRPERAAVIAEDIRAKVTAGPFTADAHPIAVKLSVGVVQANEATRTATTSSRRRSMRSRPPGSAVADIARGSSLDARVGAALRGGVPGCEAYLARDVAFALARPAAG